MPTFTKYLMCECVKAQYRSYYTVFLFLDLIKEVLSLDDEIQKLATELYQQKSVLIMGRGYHYATCLEGALVRHNPSSSPIYHSLPSYFCFLSLLKPYDSE